MGIAHLLHDGHVRLHVLLIVVARVDVDDKAVFQHVVLRHRVNGRISERLEDQRRQARPEQVLRHLHQHRR